MEINTQKSLEQFAALGMKLKSAREAHGLTIADVSANTRINQIYLQAIETGEPQPLPATAFVRGFIRNYAIAVGMDEAEMLADFKRFTDAQEPEHIPLDPPSEVENPAMISLPLPKIALIVAAVGLVVWVGYLLVTTSFAPDEEPAVAEESIDSTAAEIPPSAGGGASIIPRKPIAAEPTQPPLPVETPKNLRLRVRGLEKTWIRLSVDRREPVDVLLDPAETGEWQANEEFQLTVGKSHGVSVYLNGEEILLPREPDLLVPDIILNKVTLFKLEN